MLRRAYATMCRRGYWAGTTVLLVALVTLVIAWRSEPAYRSTVSLRLDGRTLDRDLAQSDASDYAAEHLRARYTRAVSALRDARGIGAVMTDVLIDRDSAGVATTLSFSFDVFADRTDAKDAERTARAVADAFVEDARATMGPSPANTEVERAQADIAAAADEVRRLGTEIESFERDYAMGSPDLEALNFEALQQGTRERAELDQQISALEARRIELDRGLREMEREGDASSIVPGEPLTSELLQALQVRWAVLRGRYGENHLEAAALGAEIARAQASARESLEFVSAQLREARGEHARVERLYPIDHPDVVRHAHQLSALEAQAETLRPIGLSIAERAYIEGIAGERRLIDGRIAELRAAAAALDGEMADYALRAQQAPTLARQYESLTARLTAAQARYRDASDRRAAIQKRLDVALKARPGSLSIVAAPATKRLATSRPSLIAGIGAVAGLLLVALIVALVDRLDRRITGAALIARLQGSPPMAEIPLLS